jgi:very-short-patch-repair endonuclease
VVPLLVTDLDMPSGDPPEVVAIDDEPYLNPGLLGGNLLDSATASELAAHVAGGIPFGDAVAMSQFVTEVARLIDSESAPLDPAKLDREIENRTGVFNAAAVVHVESSVITRALLEELTELEHRSDWRETAAAHLVGVVPTFHATVRRSSPAAPVVLNEAQERVIEELRTAPLTVITGPPGTGKSQVVVAAVSNAWLDGDSVLLTSTNNAAVDVAVDRARNVTRSLLIRTGNKSFRDDLPLVVGSLLSDARTSIADEASSRRDLTIAAKERQELLATIAAKRSLEAALTAVCIAAEDGARRTWASAKPPDLPKSPSQILTSALRARRARFFGDRRRQRLLQLARAASSATIDDLIAWAQAEVEFLDGSRQVREITDRTGDDEEALLRVNTRCEEASCRATAAVARTLLVRHAGTISQVATARGGGPGLPHLLAGALRGARGWACTTLAIKPNFPLTPGLFDLVIVDEASQCGLAAVLPAAYRAKRLAVVGDPNQLNPIVSIDDRRLDMLAKAHGFLREELREARQDVGTGSAFTAFARVVGDEQVRLLNEHYRCHPVIARWFNEAFYNNSLDVLTDVTAFGKGQRGLVWIDVEGLAERGRFGSVRNLAEADVVLDCLQELLKEDASIGVVSPFAAQAGWIESEAIRRFGSDALGAADFTSGTAHRLQGNEREVVVFSTVVAPGISRRTAQWVERERNLVNVAASRAQRAFIIVGHPTAAAELQVHTIESLRRAALEGLEPPSAAWRIDSEAEQRLVEALHIAGFAPLLKWNEEGYVLDIAIVLGKRRINIEVDGDQHKDVRGRSRRHDIARDRVLRGLGWEILRFPAWRCLREPQQVVDEIAEGFL